jgi:hypothetical protein
MTRTMTWPLLAAIAFGLLLLLPVIAQAQDKWSGVISTPRAIDWTGADLTATLPDRETAPNPWTPPTLSTICTLTTSSFTGMSSSSPFADSTVNSAGAVAILNFHYCEGPTI